MGINFSPQRIRISPRRAFKPSALRRLLISCVRPSLSLAQTTRRAHRLRAFACIILLRAAGSFFKPLFMAQCRAVRIFIPVSRANSGVDFVRKSFFKSILILPYPNLITKIRQWHLQCKCYFGFLWKKIIKKVLTFALQMLFLFYVVSEETLRGSKVALKDSLEGADSSIMR